MYHFSFFMSYSWNKFWTPNLPYWMNDFSSIRTKCKDASNICDHSQRVKPPPLTQKFAIEIIYFSLSIKIIYSVCMHICIRHPMQPMMYALYTYWKCFLKYIALLAFKDERESFCPIRNKDLYRYLISRRFMTSVSKWQLYHSFPVLYDSDWACVITNELF